MSEVLGILRAHVAALGTDKFLKFFLHNCFLNPKESLDARLSLRFKCKKSKTILVEIKKIKDCKCFRNFIINITCRNLSLYLKLFYPHVQAEMQLHPTSCPSVC